MTIREEFEGCITEIGANKTLSPKDDYNKGWNDASDNAIRFIRTYIAGRGLFQDRSQINGVPDHCHCDSDYPDWQCLRCYKTLHPEAL